MPHRHASFPILHLQLALAALAAAMASAADSVYPIATGATNRNHVVVVNVGGALSDEAFAKAVERAASVVAVNIWTSSIPASAVSRLVDGATDVESLFGGKAKVAVFVERNEKGPSFLNYPAHWSMVNMRGLDRDKPNAETLAMRQAKMVLKGLAYAGGGGATLEKVCAMNCQSLTLAGMDKTLLVLSPMSYFPMLETLRAVGGPEILTPERYLTAE